MWLVLLGSSYFWLQVFWGIWLLSFSAAFSYGLWAVVTLNWPSFAMKLRRTVKSLFVRDSSSQQRDRKEHYERLFDY